MGRVDAGTGREDGPAEDVQARRIVDAEIGVDDGGGWVLAHSTPAQIVAAADACKAWSAPGLRRPHLAQYLLGPVLHPCGEPLLVLAEVVGDADERHPAPVAVAGIEIEKVVLVGERVGLDADGAKVLPLADVVLVALAPRRHVGGKVLAGDLD